MGDYYSLSLWGANARFNKALKVFNQIKEKYFLNDSFELSSQEKRLLNKCFVKLLIPLRMEPAVIEEQHRKINNSLFYKIGVLENEIMDYITHKPSKKEDITRHLLNENNILN